MTSIIAHRGYSSRYRENSVPAWREAAMAGADYVEADIRFTADGIAVCAHDPDLRRLAQRSELIAELTVERLEELTIESEPVAPRFAELLTAVPAENGLLLDVKDESEQALESLHALLQTAGDRKIVLGLHQRESVAFMAARGHNAILGLIQDADDGPRFLDAGASLIRIWEADATLERLQPLLQRSIPVWSTVGDRGTDRLVGDFDPANLRRLRDAGVTGFLVNDPVEARRALTRISA